MSYSTAAGTWYAALDSVLLARTSPRLSERGSEKLQLLRCSNSTKKYLTNLMADVKVDGEAVAPGPGVDLGHQGQGDDCMGKTIRYAGVGGLAGE